MQNSFASTVKETFQDIRDMPQTVMVSIASGLLIVFFIFSAFYYGINRNFHHIIPEAIEYQNVNLGIAITEHVYGLDLGHVSHGKVHETLRKNGISFYKFYLEPLGFKFPDNASNPILINKALVAASTIEDLPTPRNLITELKPIEPNDVGMSEFYKASFALFGIRVQSFYILYFAIFCTTIALFYVRYIQCPFAVSFLAFVVGLHFSMFVYIWEILPPEQRFGVGTVYAPRFISILCIIPALHVALEICRTRKLEFFPVVTFTIQVILLAWLLTMRATVLWGILWIVGIIGLILLKMLIVRVNMRRMPADQVVAALRHLTAWPVVIFIVGIIGYTAYYKSSLSPLYRFSDEFLPTHMVWHSVYAGLELHPDFGSRFGDAHSRNGVRQYGDAMPLAGAENYLKRHFNLDMQYMVSPVYGMKYRTTERIIKEAYFELVRENPRFILDLHLIHKPNVLFGAVKYNLGKLLPNIPVSGYIGIAAAFLLLTVVTIATWAAAKPTIASFMVAVPLGLAVSLSPVIVTFPSQSVIGDQFFMIVLTVCFIFALVPNLLWRLFLAYRSRF